MIDNTGARRGWRTWNPLWGLAALWVAHLLLAVVLTVVFVSAAYAFSDDQVGSYDELSRLGNGARNGLIGIWVPFVLQPLASLYARAVDPRFGWVGGVLAILASVALAVGFFATLAYPEPVLGG
jgi:hypothetical protein